METLYPGSDVNRSERRSGGIRPWLVVLVAILVPVVSLLSSMAYNFMGPGWGYGFTGLWGDITFVNAVIIAWSGLLVGQFAVQLARIRGSVLLPQMGGMVVGLVLYLAIAAIAALSGRPSDFNNHISTFITVWIGQVAAIVLATRFAGGSRRRSTESSSD